MDDIVKGKHKPVYQFLKCLTISQAMKIWVWLLWKEPRQNSKFFPKQRNLLKSPITILERGTVFSFIFLPAKAGGVTAEPETDLARCAVTGAVSGHCCVVTTERPLADPAQLPDLRFLQVWDLLCWLSLLVCLPWCDFCCGLFVIF